LRLDLFRLCLQIIIKIHRSHC